MIEIIIYGIIWCFAVYGLFVMIQELIQKNIYNNIRFENDLNIILTVKNAEKWIENYIRELIFDGVVHKNLVIIDLESSDETMCILKKLEVENSNITVLNKLDGRNYLKKEIS